MQLIPLLPTAATECLYSHTDEVEFHDTSVEATIKQTRQSIAKIRARIKMFRHHGRTYDAQLKEAQCQIRVWTNRAKGLAESDQGKALECLSQRNQCEANEKRLNLAVEQQRRVISEGTLSLTNLQAYLRELLQAQKDDSKNFKQMESTSIKHPLNSQDLVTGACVSGYTSNECKDQLLEQLSALMSPSLKKATS